MVSNSAKLDSRTKQHTQFGVSASNGSIDMAWTKSSRKKREKKNEHGQSHIAFPTGIANNDNDDDDDDDDDNEDDDGNNYNNETGSRSPCMRPRNDPPKMKNSTPDKIVEEKKINKIRLQDQAAHSIWSLCE